MGRKMNLFNKFKKLTSWPLDRVFISDTDHESEGVETPTINQPMTTGLAVKIDDDCWIGINACILKNVTIGKHSVIKAGSVITENIPPYSVVCGNPARIVKKYNLEKRVWVKYE